MAQTNWDMIQQAMESRGCRFGKMSNGWYRTRSPLRPDSNSNSFAIRPNPDGENGGWHDHAAKDDTMSSGGFYTLAKHLGITLNGNGIHDIPTSKRGYDGLDDYAKSHGIDPDFMRRAGWREGVDRGRKALIFPTDTGERVRYLDGGKTRHMPVASEGYKGCFYLLDRAVQVAHRYKRNYLIFVNGNATVLASQQRGIPATCITDGEKQLPQHLLDELKTKWTGKIIIALDCDPKGRQTAMKIKEQLGDQGLPVEMPLSENGDFADFCRLYEDKAYEEIVNIAISQNDVQDSDLVNPHATNALESTTVRSSTFDVLYGNKPASVRITLNPFRSMHKFGGYAKFWMSQKVMLVIAPTGGGKTQFVETANDGLNRDGVNTMIWGDEWSPEELELRRISRFNEVTPHEILEHLYMLQQVKDNKDISGIKSISAPKLQAMQKTMDTKFDSSAGVTQYLSGGKSIEEIIQDMEVAIEKFVRYGKPIDVVFIDYVQLARTGGSVPTGNVYEYILQLIKEFAIRNNVFVVGTSQTTKIASQSAKDNAKITVESAQYLRADKANAVLMLNRQYYTYNNELVPSPCYFCDIGKLSVIGDWQPNMRVPLLMIPSSQYFMEFDWTIDRDYDHIPGNKFYESENKKVIPF